MQNKNVLILFASAFMPAAAIALCQAPSQSKPISTWVLPQGASPNESAPRPYRFTVDYNTANPRGEVIYRQHVTGDYTSGLPRGEVVWNNVTVADAAGPAATFPPAQRRDFMEGFRYRKHADNTLGPDFFKSFPATAVVERNLVWDTGMIEMFGQDYFDKLTLNQPFTYIADKDIAMPGVGRFHARAVVLEWNGRSERNGQDCALIRYESFFNPLDIANGSMNLKGRSDFWGEIWVSLATKQIEYATLHEVVVGEMTLAGQSAPQAINVFRTGIFEPVNAK